MEVYDLNKVVNNFNNLIKPPEDYKISNVEGDYGFVVVHLSVKDCYDHSLSPDMLSLAKNFLYSHNGWINLINSFKRGVLIESNVNRFINNVNEDFYENIVLSENFNNVRNGLNKQLETVVDNLDIEKDFVSDVDLKLVVKKDNFYKTGYVLERIAEYSYA